ncbi:MAG TPA: hypothetical protein VFF68_09175 [Anaerolineaceae bacterium]|nr:hypothetical protein [Anaerolineaceae bacterium]
MRVLLVDDHKEVLAALRVALEHHFPGWTFVEIGSLSALIAEIGQARCNLLILDWGMCGVAEKGSLPQQLWQTILAAIHHAAPDLGILVLDSTPDTSDLAIAAGAQAFVCKTDPPETLFLALRRLADRPTTLF